MDLSGIPLLDHHCHALRRPEAPLEVADFRRHFSESRDPAMERHAPFSLFYSRALRDLAAFLGCEPTEDAVLAARRTAEPEAHARRLVEAAHIGAMLVDTGFRGIENYTLEEQRGFLPCAIHEVLRLETLVERLIGETDGFAAFEDAYRATLAEARSRGIVALKSIAAYRGGLEVRRRSRAEAAAAYPPVKEEARRAGSVRLSDRPLLEYTLRVALEEAAAQELPVQFHTGFGDDDADLRTASPLHLRPLLQDEALWGAPIVLLHAWPFAREAGYLAGISRHVYVDLSLAIPFTAHGGVAAIRAALEQAPTSKLLLATDAFSIPELFYLGALYARHSLAAALQQLREEGWLTGVQAEQAAWQALYRNAAAVYGVG
jgi:predicted TIM-barrel fold metal-dependent hydrolase